MTGVLLFIWFVTTFVTGFFARDLTFTVLGWPLSFWVASQGSLIDHTTPSVRQARQSVAWSLFFICLLYLTVPCAGRAGEVRDI